jgi:hypothetical protein
MATGTNVNVNRPTNPKLKEADINRKLQVYGIFSAFQNGKVPSVGHPDGFAQPRTDYSARANTSLERANRRCAEQLLGFSSFVFTLKQALV